MNNIFFSFLSRLFNVYQATKTKINNVGDYGK